MPEIIDVIMHTDAYHTSPYIVLDSPLNLIYERHGNYLIGEDSGFFGFLAKKPFDKRWPAFGGREFDIPLLDGSVEKAYGQYWDEIPDDWCDLVAVVGASSLPELNECYVFSGFCVDTQLIEKWLLENEPSNNYNKYNKRHENYAKQIVFNRFEKVVIY